MGDIFPFSSPIFGLSVPALCGSIRSGRNRKREGRADPHFSTEVTLF